MRQAAGLENYRPSWPLPKIFRMTKGGRLIESLFAGETINTPSMLCLEDYLDTLGWAKRLGGLPALHGRVAANAAALDRWVMRTPWIDYLARDPATRSPTSVCLSIIDPTVAVGSEAEQRAFTLALVDKLEAEGAGFDFGAYRDAPPGLRIWCGATVEAADVAILTEWLDWGFAALRAPSARAA